MPSRQGQRIRDSRGRTLRLGRLLKSGGAGSVFLLEGPGDEVAKLYHASVDQAVYRRKLEAMLGLCPDLPDRVEGARRFVQIAWPRATAFDHSGRFLGFVMPRLSLEDTSDLEHVLLERQARAAGLPTGIGPRMALAANLATTLAALHERGHYVVDLKPLNLRFHRESLHIAMLDCDGFSILGDGERFPAGQVTPDYLAPEFQRGGVTPGGEEAQDHFALAVIVFQLINHGIHPYSGRPAVTALPSDLPGRIRENLYAYGLVPDRRIEAAPTSGHDGIPERLRRLFDRAFSRQPGRRPSASEWSGVLVEYARRQSGLLVACPRNRDHQHFRGEACTSCRRGGLVAAARSSAKRKPKRGRRSAARPRPGRAAPAHAPAAGRRATTGAPGQSSRHVRLTAGTQQLFSATVLALVAPPLLGWVFGWGFSGFREYQAQTDGYWASYPSALWLLVAGLPMVLASSLLLLVLVFVAIRKPSP